MVPPPKRRCRTRSPLTKRGVSWEGSSSDGLADGRAEGASDQAALLKLPPPVRPSDRLPQSGAHNDVVRRSSMTPGGIAFRKRDTIPGRSSPPLRRARAQVRYNLSLARVT